MTVEARLAALEQQLLDQEHHARIGLGRLDGRYLDRQMRRRELTLELFNELRAEVAALRLVRASPVVVLTAAGFKTE